MTGILEARTESPRLEARTPRPYASEIAVGPGGQTPTGAQTPFSADGFWWWDGAEWRAALSPDRFWRWNGQAWEPARAAASPRAGAGAAVAITVGVFVGVLLIVSILTVAVLATVDNQITNVFSNVVAALASPPSP